MTEKVPHRGGGGDRMGGMFSMLLPLKTDMINNLSDFAGHQPSPSLNAVAKPSSFTTSVSWSSSSRASQHFPFPPPFHLFTS